MFSPPEIGTIIPISGEDILVKFQHSEHCQMSPTCLKKVTFAPPDNVTFYPQLDQGSAMQ